VITGAGNFSSRGRDDDEAEDNVVVIATAWPEAGNDLASQIIPHGGSAVVNDGRAGATFDQAVGVRWPTMIRTSKRIQKTT
jgi:hypothetical protein